MGGKPMFTGLVRDITERKRAEEALREADRRKDEFLAMLVHELRNPLAPISNSLVLLEKAEEDPDLLGRARQIMERQLAHMVRLVDDLLDVSRITRDKLTLHKRRIELASLIHQAVETCRPLAEREEQEIDVTLPDEPVYLEGDSVRLAQVFSNLLDNASKYTPRGRTIGLGAERRGSDVVVTVRDSGIGIPPEQLDRIFEMFTQVDQTIERTRGGLGIGLTLVKRLVELHGGRIEARSEGAGRGSEFIVRLPMQVERSTSPSPQVTTANSSATTPRRILVVDDNSDSVRSLAELLNLSGHQTQVAYDGLGAIEAAERFRPDVILLDIGLPKLNGLDACRRIRAHPWGQEPVMVALTGWAQDEDRRKSRDAGFDDHMVKPVNFEALQALLSSLPPKPASESGEGVR